MTGILSEIQFLETASQLLSINPLGFSLHLFLFHPDCFYHQYARTESLTEKRDLASQERARGTSEFPRILNILPIFLTLFLVNYEACDFKCSFLHMGKSNIYSYFSSTFNIFHVSLLVEIERQSVVFVLICLPPFFCWLRSVTF